MSDPRKAPDLDAASRNPDGTYNGVRALSWISAAVARGLGSKSNGLSETEVAQIWQAVQAKKKRPPSVFD